MKPGRLVAVGFSLGLMLAVADEAQAERGVVLDPTVLGSQQRATLAAEVARARTRDAAAFARVRRIRDRIAQYDGRKRGRYVSVTHHFKSLGTSALFPMLAMVALEARPRGDLSRSAWLSLRVGLIEAVGMLRDPRARPVLEAILDRRPPEFQIDRAAAEALARLADDAAASKLVSMARAPGPKRVAVLTAIGNCRRAVVARELADMLSERPAADRARLIILALRDVGNGWAWKTPVIRASGEEQQVRPVAARALVEAFVAYRGQLRRAAAKALLVVDDPSTPSLIEAARRDAPPVLAIELEQLARKFARNPAR